MQSCWTSGEVGVNRQSLVPVALKIVWLVLPILTVIAFVVVEMRHVVSMITVSNVDYFPMVERALQLSLGSWDGWVSWKHPVGMSLLIRLGYELGWDVERVGQAWSIIGGVLVLCGTFLLARSVFRDRRFAALALAFLASSSVFLMYASIEENDMVAAGLQILSLSLLATATLGRDALDWKLVFLGGLMAGLSYLIRYNGMITAMASGLWLAILATFERRPAAWKAIGLYASAFLLGSAVQWIPSLIVTGNPFYNDQGQNVWFHVFAKTDYLREWQQAPPNITVVQVFLMDPRRFISFWWSWFSGFWTQSELALLDAPLKLLGQAGLAFLILAPGPASKKVRGLVGLYVLAHLGSISMMRLQERFLLIILPVLTIGAVYLLVAIIPPHGQYRRAVVPLSLLVLLVGLVWAAKEPFDFATKRPGLDMTVIQSSNALHAAGMRSANEVLSTHTKLQDASSPARLRFVQAYAVTPDFKSVDELVQAMRSNGWRFFLYHRDYGATIYPSLQDVLSAAKCPPDLAPIYFHDNGKFVICRLNDGAEGYTPVTARLESGIVLEGYEAHLAPSFPAGSGQLLGVYLYWRTEAKLTHSFKVFVHLLNTQGQPVAQDDSVPVLWTYSTDEWKPGEVVIDFHELLISASVPPGEYTLQVGLYDEASGVRLKRVDAAGSPLADTIVLSKITIQ
jgi:hypothetical protein